MMTMMLTMLELSRGDGLHLRHGFSLDSTEDHRDKQDQCNLHHLQHSRRQGLPRAGREPGGDLSDDAPLSLSRHRQ